MLLLYHARIYTLDPQRPQASAILINGARILAVGGEELLAGVDGRAEKEDLGGGVLLPGLTDAHIHLRHYALGLQKVDCETETFAECLRRLEERARRAEDGEWILGHGWNQNTWADAPQDAQGRVPGFGNSADLDAIAPDNPIYLTAKSMHAAWVNSAALARAGITAGTPDPDNGRIQRDADGRPTGILLENAMQLVERLIPTPSLSQAARAIEEAQKALWRVGITGVHDFDRRLCFMALQELRARGALRLRVLKSIPVEDLPHAAAVGLRTGFGDDYLRIGGVKVFMDGALGPRTAAMLRPYLGEPENRGLLNLDGEELFEIGRRAAESGLSLAVHAIGDRANHEALDGLERLRRYEEENRLPRLRHRIEHVQVIHPDDAPRLAALGVIASMQPIHATSDMEMAERYWGARAALAYAWRTQLQHGARLVFGSDAPVEAPNPFLGLYAAVTRRRADGSPGPEGWYPEQRLKVEEALRGFTIGPAYAAGMEAHLGRLSPGYLADMILLEEDPFTCPPERLLHLRPRATMVGGEWCWKA